ncbi:MAG: regulatory protein RecX [Flavobacteriaceae bacterium]|nr:regulatory protein RecX [Flavobacteriaceae bacterium]
MTEKKLTYTLEEATRLLEGYCVYQDRCHVEVEKKLKSMHMIPAAIQKITLHLLENNFLNEERFAKSFTRGKHKIKKWGRRRIENELIGKEISLYNIRTGLQEIGEEEYRQNLEKLAEKKLNELGGKVSSENMKKLFTYLVQKGYETDLVYGAIGNLPTSEK